MSLRRNARRAVVGLGLAAVAAVVGARGRARAGGPAGLHRRRSATTPTIPTWDSLRDPANANPNAVLPFGAGSARRGGGAPANGAGTPPTGRNMTTVIYHVLGRAGRAHGERRQERGRHLQVPVPA